MSSTVRPPGTKARGSSSRVSPAPARLGPSSPASRVAAISAEIPLEVHGSRKSQSDGHPVEAFQEETVSVIVFPQGGIVRLATVVSKGQMVAITNLNTQRGMLGRVVNVRAYPNLKNYVEVEFTQSASGFWGVSFPNEVSEQAAPPPDPAAAVKQRAASKPAAPARREANDGVSHPIVDDSNVVHVTSDEDTSSARPPALKPEDFWGASFPSEMIEAAAPEKTPANASSKPKAETVPAPEPEIRQESTEHSEPLELAIDNDETWADLLSQLPKKMEQPAPAKPPEVVEEEIHLEKIEPSAVTPEPSAAVHASASPKAAPRQPSASAPPTEDSSSATPATLKELERLALGHLDMNRDAPQQSRPAPNPPTANQPRTEHSSHEAPHAHKTASSAAPLHAFTSPSGGNARPLPPRPPAPKADRQSFGNFLKDPEPRTAAQRVFSENSDVMTASILAVDLSKPPQVAKSGSGWFFAVAGLLILIAGGGWIYIQNVKSAHMPAVVGRPVAEQAPLPPGNLKPNEEPYESPDAAASPSAADPSSAAPDTGVEVDLTTAVPPPAKKGTAPAESPKSQAKPANRRGNIPPLNLSAPTSNDDGPTTTNVEPPPDVSGHSAASGNGEPLNKIAVYSAANVPRPTSPASAGSLPVGGKVIEPKLIWSEPPVYPIPAKEANIQGDVKIDATINESGHVAKMKVISGPTLLQQAALNAVRNWKYEPSTLDGKPVLSQLVVTVQFRR